MNLFYYFSSFISTFQLLGTNVCPGAAESSYYDRADYLTKYLDTSKCSESEKVAMTTLINHHKIHGTPYLCFGRGSGTFQLNEDNLVNSIFFEWKLTSICSPIIERNFVYERGI